VAFSKLLERDVGILDNMSFPPRLRIQQDLALRHYLEFPDGPPAAPA
jgi:hypothetical protein